MINVDFINIFALDEEILWKVFSEGLSVPLQKEKNYECIQLNMVCVVN